MKKLLAILAVATVAFLAAGNEPANAQGIHIGGRGVHIDIGRPHGAHYGHHRSFYGGGHSYRGYHGGHAYHGGHGGWGGHRSHYRWHDTSHYDFHPGSYVRHYDHYDYVPPHYDYHREGHWDRH